MHFGFEVGPYLPQADVVVVLDAPVPWIPRAVQPRADATIIHISADPLLVRYPFRDFEADLLITAETAAALSALQAALADAMRGRDEAIAARRRLAAKLQAERMARLRQQIEAARTQLPISPLWLAACIDAAKREDAVIVSELGIPLAPLTLRHPGSYMGNMLAGGLGMGLGAGLGAKLAAPEREVIVTVGDGSYMFGNPLPYHYVAQAEGLPTLTVVANNQSWHAVRRATLDVYPEGAAAKANVMPLTELKPSPAFERIVEATGGGYAQKVEHPAELPQAVERALAAVRAGTPAVLNVLTGARS
jgi:acetolactate synthase-1/2/3 large subunit